MPWDIKRASVWEKTLYGITYPGLKTPVVFCDLFLSPEQLGNVLFGYAGTAAGFSEKILLAGSIYASGVWRNFDPLKIKNETEDHTYIKIGINIW